MPRSFQLYGSSPDALASQQVGYDQIFRRAAESDRAAYDSAVARSMEMQQRAQQLDDQARQQDNANRVNMWRYSEQDAAQSRGEDRAERGLAQRQLESAMVFKEDKRRFDVSAELTRGDRAEQDTDRKTDSYLGLLDTVSKGTLWQQDISLDTILTKYKLDANEIEAVRRAYQQTEQRIANQQAEAKNAAAALWIANKEKAAREKLQNQQPGVPLRPEQEVFISSQAVLSPNEIDAIDRQESRRLGRKHDRVVFDPELREWTVMETGATKPGKKNFPAFRGAGAGGEWESNAAETGTSPSASRPAWLPQTGTGTMPVGRPRIVVQNGNRFQLNPDGTSVNLGPVLR